jgi:hypothetical protein
MISSIDNKSFDSIFNEFVKLSAKASSWYYDDGPCDTDSLERRDCTDIENMRNAIANTGNEQLMKVFRGVIPKFLKINRKWNYTDYISMVSQMDDFKNFKITFKDEEEICAMHDAANVIYNLKRNEYRAKAFKEQLKKVEKLEYENKDDDFCVVIPTEPGDLANEGLELHHCVKSYIEKVADGNTNIVFIRKKDEKEKPFFTVEVSNDKTIEQVHGFGNRNADTESGLTEFVNRWARNKHLRLQNINKVR